MLINMLVSNNTAKISENLQNENNIYFFLPWLHRNPVSLHSVLRTDLTWHQFDGDH